MSSSTIKVTAKQTTAQEKDGKEIYQSLSLITITLLIFHFLLFQIF
jgi:hypothetical protein